MSYAAWWDFFIIFGVPVLIWKFIGAPFLAWWKTIRGLTGITFVPREEGTEDEEDEQ